MRYCYILTIVCLFILGSCSTKQENTIDLSGEWRFQVDSLDKGEQQEWYTEKLPETINLPGSMAINGKGEDISVNTRWTGQIVDNSWFTDEKYARYRKEGNIKIPFWLQPKKHYVGAAWYQKTVTIPNNWAEQHVELFLERAHWETTVWIDNNKIGDQNFLGTPHQYDLTKHLTPGKHTITIRVDNRTKAIDPGMNSHSISDHTQSNWNGIVGEIALKSSPLILVDDIKIYPDIKDKSIRIKGHVNYQYEQNIPCKLHIQVAEKGNSNNKLKPLSFELDIRQAKEFDVSYSMGEDPQLWDEFNPFLYEATIDLESTQGVASKTISFGMREFKVNNTQFAVNGRPIFLRGTLECAIFPKTGYPTTNVGDWKRILNICKAHGLNHMRFHSWCPPKAAFVAADELGVYLQVECSSWANSGSSIGDQKPIDQWLYKEGEQILKTYGNHPSFCLMAYGNEPGGKNQGTYLTDFVNHFRNKDPRRVYTGGAGWPYIESLDYYNNAAPRIQGWGQQLNSIINKQAPQTNYDFKEIIDKIPMPYVSHEIGQWCAYPNFKEIKKYTGILQAKNFEIFQETLNENNLGHLADSFLLASGKLQALCYKADIEAALRTKGFAGFQLLDLHDFPGQGTALVGVLDAFWEEKGYITPEEYSKFCNSTVPLCRLEKRVFYDNEVISAQAEVAHFGATKISNAASTWQLTNTKQEVIVKGTLPSRDIPMANGVSLGNIDINLPPLTKAEKLTLTVSVENFSNNWDIWVYPSKKTELNNQNIKVVQELTPATLALVRQGGKVLLTLPKGKLKEQYGGNIGIGFSSIFWNTAWTRGQKPHTLGILCNPQHPALIDFPTEYHSNWQWWDAMTHSNALNLDAINPKLNPIVRVVDDWFENRSLGLLFEAKIGKGKILVSGIDLLTDQQQRPEAEQLLYSLMKYMSGEQFQPQIELSEQKIKSIYQ
ncbi:beta-galactosidase [Puteibacter caeruleilacunae]|nr:beta-galactosidase [Puteibacter caeruleilacunae]